MKRILKKISILLVLALAMPSTALADANPFIGEILLFGGNFCPRGFEPLNGQIIAISSNEALFSLVGTFYGGDGRSTFGLPDLRGRTPLHMGQGPGLSNRDIGSQGGLEEVTLTNAQVPNHSHSFVALEGRGVTTNARSNFIAAGSRLYRATGTIDKTLNSASFTTYGQGQPHQNMPPFGVITYCISETGVFPSRS